MKPLAWLTAAAILTLSIVGIFVIVTIVCPVAWLLERDHDL